MHSTNMLRKEFTILQLPTQARVPQKSKPSSAIPFSKVRDQKEERRATRNVQSLNLSPTRTDDEDKENSRVSKNYDAILRMCFATGTKFVDEDFPAGKESLYRSNALRRTLQIREEENFFKGAQDITAWHRPENIRTKGNESEWVIINDPQPSDICQGRIGNCWFVAALTLIAERKELLAKILGTAEINRAGAYLVRLFKDGAWQDIIVDDLLPCDSFHRLVFSSCRRKQLWVMLIEKAMAKLHGSYESLQSGSIWDGLNYLTGFVSERIYLKSEEDRELLWGRLLSFYSCGFLMGASISTDRSIERVYEEKGLVANHVYSILQVKCYEKTRLIQLRNPWGRFSWNGEWSDNSFLWSESMRRKFSPNKSHEGIFWMSFNDFMRYFTCLDVCQIRQNWKTYTMAGILPPFADSDCQPLFEITCEHKTCELDISLYQSCKRNSREFVKLTDIGFLIFEFEITSSKSSSKEIKLLKLVKMAKSSRRRCVTVNVMLPKGRYCVAPFSFGNWTQEEHQELFYAFNLTIHCSHEIKCRTIRPADFPYILADAMGLVTKKYGKEKNFTKHGVYEAVSAISVNLGVGYCTIVENNSKNYVEFEMTTNTDPEYRSTRDSHFTIDRVPPFHRQVVQVLTAEDPYKSGKISNTYQLQIVPQDLISHKDSSHYPVLSGRISGLHTPRPIVVTIGE